MMRKTNSRTGKRSKKEERVLGREALSKPISEYEKESLDSENSGYNLSLILSKFLGMANRLVNLADSEMSRIEQIQEEKRLSTEQEMWGFLENEVTPCLFLEAVHNASDATAIPASRLGRPHELLNAMHIVGAIRLTQVRVAVNEGCSVPEGE